jgi:hypothetical protein
MGYKLAGKWIEKLVEQLFVTMANLSAFLTELK